MRKGSQIDIRKGLSAMSKRIDHDSDKRNIRYPNLLKYSSILLGVVLLGVSIIMWRVTQSDSLVTLSKSVVAETEIYANQITSKYNRIQASLELMVDSSPPNTIIKERDWDRQADFYIQNSAGLKNILWLDRNLIVRRIGLDDSHNILGERINYDHGGQHEHQYEIYPVYLEDYLEGFIVGDMCVTELMLSVLEDNRNDYMAEVFFEGRLIATTSNWIETDYDASSTFSVSFNSRPYSVKVWPTQSFIDFSTRNSRQALVYGVILSILVSGLAFFLQKYRSKSTILLEAQNILVSNQAELEDQNRLLESQLRDQQRLKSIGELASSIAHEINNPITGIMNYSQIIYDSYNGQGENAEFASEIINETKRVSQLVENLLQFSRQRSSGFSIARPEDVISRTINLVRVIFKKDQINLQLKIADVLPNIACNSQQIQQVLINLFTNARDALNERFPGYDENKEVLLTCRAGERDGKQVVVIAIKDYGNGIPKEIQDRIYSQFYTTKEAGKGTGIGLYISARIIEEHHGWISFETEEGYGTTFFIELPAISTSDVEYHH